MHDKKRKLEDENKENKSESEIQNVKKKIKSEGENIVYLKKRRGSFQSPLPKTSIPSSEVVKIYIERYKEKALIQMISEKNGKAALYFLTEKSFQEDLKKCINVTDQHQKNAIYFAIEKGLSELIKPLAEQGFDINAKSKFYENPLYYAINKDNTKAIEILLALKCNVDFVTQSRCMTPIHLAVIQESTALSNIIESLVENGCDINKACSYGKSAIHYAIESDRAIELISILCDNGADINKYNRLGNNISHIMFKEHNINLEILYNLSFYDANLMANNKKFKAPIDYLLTSKASNFLSEGVNLRLQGLYLEVEGLNKQANEKTSETTKIELVEKIKTFTKQIRDIETKAKKLKARYIAYCFTSIVQKHSLNDQKIEVYCKELIQFVTITNKLNDFMVQYLELKNLDMLSGAFPNICKYITKSKEQNQEDIDLFQLQKDYLLNHAFSESMRKNQYRFCEKMCKYLIKNVEGLSSHIMHYIDNNTFALKELYLHINKEKIVFEDKQAQLLLENLDLKPYKGNEEYFKNNVESMCKTLIYNTLTLKERKQQSNCK